MVKRFLLFSYYADQPQGGAKDFWAGFDSVKEALEQVREERRRYYQVVDSETMEVIKEGLALFKRFDSPAPRRKNSRAQIKVQDAERSMRKRRLATARREHRAPDQRPEP